MLCVAMKEFTGNGEDFVRNQLVEGSQFRNEQVLIQTRYLRPATEQEIKSARLVSDTPAKPLKKKSSLKVRLRRSA